MPAPEEPTAALVLLIQASAVQEYELTLQRPEMPFDSPVFRLRTRGGLRVYEVSDGHRGPSCTCKAFTKGGTGEECKHIRCLRKVGLLP